MIFFDYDQFVKIHSLLVANTGGTDGVRDKNLLESALKTPFQTFDGSELYQTILDKASQFCYSLIENIYTDLGDNVHLDGNKRIGVHLTLLFLKLNGVELSYSQNELIEFGLNIASGKVNKEDIKNWLHSHINLQA